MLLRPRTSAQPNHQDNTSSDSKVTFGLHTQVHQKQLDMWLARSYRFSSRFGRLNHPLQLLQKWKVGLHAASSCYDLRVLVHICVTWEDLCRRWKKSGASARATCNQASHLLFGYFVSFGVRTFCISHIFCVFVGNLSQTRPFSFGGPTDLLHFLQSRQVSIADSESQTG